ncbi:MAG: hypothetical protein Ct9H300mP23_02270 [Nitrospinota bacterium]|nr:MAG: hypothetical protein Ct9H300mP23_02270 [Nitrospinota bacterium]
MLKVFFWKDQIDILRGWSLGGKETLAHVPDPGRLPGLLLPNRKVRLVHQPSKKRKTDYTLVLVRHGSIWVSVFPAFANSLVSKH